MEATYVALIAALITSPFTIAAFEAAKNWIVAKVKYRGWQAVFIDNGQVYFGHIRSATRHEMVITDIYYMQVKENQYLTPENLSGEISLAKLGNELHGPKDRMYISAVHVVFTENLKNDGDVVRAIKEYEGANANR